MNITKKYIISKCRLYTNNEVYNQVLGDLDCTITCLDCTTCLDCAITYTTRHVVIHFARLTATLAVCSTFTDEELDQLLLTTPNNTRMKCGILGEDTPAKLIDTLVYCFGFNFALRRVDEHRNLRPDMLQLVEPPDSTAYLLYIESGSKNV